MEEFKVRISGLRKAAGDEKKISDNLGQIADDIQHVKNRLRAKIIIEGRLNERLKQIINSVDDEKVKMKRQSDQLYLISNTYDRAERRICQTDGFLWPVFDINPWNPIFAVLGPCVAMADFLDLLDEGDIEFSTGVTDYTPKKIKDYFKEKEKSWRKKGDFLVRQNEDGSFTRIGNKGRKEEKQQEKDRFEADQMDKAATLFSLKKEEKDALFSREDEMDAGWVKGSYEYSVKQREKVAEVYGGIYATGPDGERKFAPGFGAEIGVGGSLFHFEGEGQLGSDALGVYGETEIEVGKVELKGGADLGLFGKDGSVNPQAHIGGSMEVIAAEMSGTVGGVIAGTKIGATGRVNVGFGAHADVGLKDGKLSLDLGASFGVGASVKLDIDISGTIDAVCSFAKSAWDLFKF